MNYIINRIIKTTSRLILVFIFIGCKQNSSKESEILAIPLSVSIERFDKEFYLSNPEVIPKLKKNYSFLFPQKFTDSVWFNRQKDSLQLMLLDTVESIFPDMTPIENDLEYLLKHLKYYFPKIKIPRVIGLINSVDYQSKAIYADSLILISLDTYFGADHPLYNGIPNYVRQEMDIKYLSSHLTDKYVEHILQPPRDRTLLSQMIYHGKKIYVKDLILPIKSNAIKMCYTDEQINWVKENEIYIWQYFIENQLLYNTSPSLQQRFIEPAPFSKFYLEIDNESPGRIGVWLGWQIIKSYISRHPKTDINEILSLPAQTIFSKSNYKPRK
ncbi:MAG: gliding motility lipoprotein GldB [Bacteroidota bacterium]|nr:gliding motility lipoprotein GldB [Bacteroidota bacterium]